MTSSYDFQGGTYDPVTQTDVVPEMEADYANIERSENEFFQSLRDNDRRIADQAGQQLKALSGLSGKIGDLLEIKNKKYREEEEARGVMLAMERGASPELIAKFRGEEQELFEGHKKTTEFAHNYENSTGDFVGGEEFRKLSGYAQYAFAKRYAKDEAKKWQQYKYEAQQTTTIKINRNGELVEIKYNDAQNQAEQDAINAKIKFNFGKRFNGMNEVLIADVVKPEIDKVDESDRQEANRKRQEAIIQARKDDEEFDIETNFVTADPARGSQYALDWVEEHRFQYGGRAGARTAFADHLEKLVKEGRISLGEAQSIVGHEFKGNDGSIKSLTSWTQWRDLDGRLLDAHSDAMTLEEERQDAEIEGLVEQLKSSDDYTLEQKLQIADKFKENYGYVPEKVSNLLAEYEDDDAAKIRLNTARAAQGGILFDYQLNNVSPTIKNAYSSYVKAGGALELGTAESKEADEYVQIFTNEILETDLGESDAKTLRWKNLNIGLKATYNTAYATAIKEGFQPSAAHKAGLQALSDVQAKPGVYKKMFSRNLAMDELDISRKTNTITAKTQGAGGGWKTSRLAADTKDEQDLIKWTKTGMSIEDIPEYYRNLASQLKVNPLALAKAQAKQMNLDIDDEVDESKYGSNNKLIQNLVFYKPSKSRAFRAEVLTNEEKSGEKANAKTSEFNKKATMMPGV